MGLRINTNLGALTALRGLRINNVEAARIFERLSTGLQINRASDNPAGAVMLAQFEAETRSLGQAIENTQSAQNLVRTAEAGLSEIQNQLVNLRAQAVGAMNTGGESSASIAARQNSVDQSLAAIDRIAQTTRFGDVSLLNGSLGFNLTNVDPNLTSVNVTQLSATTNFPATVSVNVTSAATQGTATGAIAPVQAADVTFRIQGNLGQADISVQAGATQAEVVAAINSYSDQTGVIATGAGVIQAQDYGSNAFVNVQNVTGTLTGVTTGYYAGTDVQGTINGQAVSGQGNSFSISSQSISGQFAVTPGAVGTFNFTVEGGGARFQIGTGSNDAVLIGIGPAYAASLGESGGLGNLTSIRTGGANSLLNNPGGALNVAGAATTELSLQRSTLGGLEAHLLSPIRNTLSQQFENLTASKSTLGDADFAEQIAAMVRNQVLRQSGVNVLRQAALSSNAVLRLIA